MIRRAFIIAALLLTVPGCAAFAKWLPVVISVLGEAGQVLDAVDNAAGSYFAANPDEEKQKTYGRIMSKARSSLALAHRAAKGTDAAAKQDVDTAFGEFKKAYQDLLALLGPLGVVAPAQGDGAMSAPAGDGPLLVPPPETLTL